MRIVEEHDLIRKARTREPKSVDRARDLLLSIPPPNLPVVGKVADNRDCQYHTRHHQKRYRDPSGHSGPKSHDEHSENGAAAHTDGEVSAMHLC